MAEVGKEVIPEDAELAVLVRDYELMHQQVKHAEERFYQIASAVFTTLVAVTGIVLNQADLLVFSSLVASITPVLSVFLLTVLLYQFYEQEGSIRRARIIAEQINFRLGSIILSEYSPSARLATFYSLRHGNIKYRMLLLTFIVLCGGLYVTANVLAIRLIYAGTHFWGFLTSVLVTFATFVLAFAFHGIYSDLPKNYDGVYEEVRKTGEFPRGAEPSSPKQDWRVLAHILLPRKMLIEKGGAFWIGFIGALAISGIQKSQIDLINAFFRQGKDYELNTVPPWSIWALGVIYFFVDELLLQQAKYLWNDIRDRDWDSRSSYHRNRAFAEGSTTEKWAILHVVIRWTFALVLGYLLGGLQLLLLFIFISLHQVLYVLWGKPNGEKHPVALLAIISFNLAPRFLVGVAAVSGESWTALPIALLFVAFHFFSFGFMAMFWRLQATDNSIPRRPQSEYFLLRGESYQHQGFLGAIIASMLLLSGYLAVAQHNQFVTLETLLGSAAASLGHAGLRYVWFFVLSLLFVLGIHFVSLVLRTLFSPLRAYLAALSMRVKTVAMIISYAIFVFGLAFSVAYGNARVFAVAFLFMNVGAMFMYEGMTWDELMSRESKRQMPVLAKLWLAYLFLPPERLDKLCCAYSLSPTLRNLLLISLQVLSNKTVFPEKVGLPQSS